MKASVFLLKIERGLGFSQWQSLQGLWQPFLQDSPSLESAQFWGHASNGRPQGSDRYSSRARPLQLRSDARIPHLPTILRIIFISGFQFLVWMFSDFRFFLDRAVFLFLHLLLTLKPLHISRLRAWLAFRIPFPLKFWNSPGLYRALHRSLIFSLPFPVGASRWRIVPRARISQSNCKNTYHTD